MFNENEWDDETHKFGEREIPSHHVLHIAIAGVCMFWAITIAAIYYLA